MDEDKVAIALRQSMAITEADPLYGPDAEDSWKMALQNQEGHYLEMSEAHIYKGVQNIPKLKEAYLTFMRGGDLREISEEIGIEERTVLKWAAMGGWVQRRQDVEEVRLQEAEQKIIRLRADNLPKATEDQLNARTALHAKIMSMIEKLPDNARASDVKNLSDALKSNTEAASRALGIDQNGLTNVGRAKDEAGKDDGRRSLVVVVQGGGLPDIRKAEGGPMIIDVTGD